MRLSFVSKRLTWSVLALMAVAPVIAAPDSAYAQQRQSRKAAKAEAQAAAQAAADAEAPVQQEELVPPAIEDSPANRLEAANALVAMLDMERTLDSMFANLKSLFAENVVANMSRDPKGAEFFNKVEGGRDRFSAVLADEFLAGLRARYPEFRAAAGKEYAKQFTVQELQQLTAFFGSGVGEKWRMVAPNIEKSMSAWGEQVGQKVGMEAMMTVMTRFQDEQQNGKKK
ncbi:MAG: DUF2059 domain-containing protein [Sphingobium sp.]|nr:DUF2059 domain-containing protein [Sphingobium sp.]